MGNPLAFTHFSKNFCFLEFYLRPKSHFALLLPQSTTTTSPEDGEILVEVADIAKVVAEEATKIAAEENLVQIAMNFGEIPGESEKPTGNMSTPDEMDVEEVPIDADELNPDNQLAASMLQAPPSSLELVVYQHGSGAPSSSGTMGLNFDEEIA